MLATYLYSEVSLEFSKVVQLRELDIYPVLIFDKGD